MRIVLLLAAAGAAALATAAPARSAAKPGGHGAATPGTWAVGGGHRARSGWEGRSRPALGRGDGRHGGRHARRGGRHQVYLDGGYAFAGPGGIVEPWGEGFFAGGGGEVRMKGSRPHYDYDRSYPFEWAPPARDRREWEDEPRPAEPRPRCTMEHGVRVCRGW